jgi:hypothetical protein
LFQQILSIGLLRKGETKAESNVGIHPQERSGSMWFVEGAVKKELQIETG